MDLHIGAVAEADFEAVFSLLDTSDLPTSDLAPEGLRHFVVAREGPGPVIAGSAGDGTIVGVVGLERFDRVGLLRSLAVAPEARGHGLGRALVVELEQRAVEAGVDELYLLTTTADAFFERLGYALADRASAPEAIRQTREFAELCSDSATLMSKRLLG